MTDSSEKKQIQSNPWSKPGPQVLFVLISWILLVYQGYSSDGLIAIDAPKHASNGIFLMDFLQDLPKDPRNYAVDYFTRYPLINPVPYPPFFYLLEAIVFGMFGISPFYAKYLVLGFCLLGSLYVLIWIRRWICPEAGYFACLIPLIPIMSTWSNQVMLNVPAAVLLWMGAYHAKLWMENPHSRQLYLAALFSTLSVLTYYPSAIVVPVILAWLCLDGKWKLIFARRTLLTAFISGLALAPFFVLVMKTAPTYVAMTKPSPRLVSEPNYLLFYITPALGLFGAIPVALAVIGAIFGLVFKRFRKETVFNLAWLGITFLFLTYIKEKDRRYFLPCSAPILLLATIGVVSLVEYIKRLAGKKMGLMIILPLIASIFFFSWFQSFNSKPDSINGIREIVEFLETVAPEEPVFFDGPYKYNFVFYIRATDQGRKKMVVRGDKLLYLKPATHVVERKEFVNNYKELMEMLRKKSGCRWYVIQRSYNNTMPAEDLLRDAVKKQPFEFVRTFPISRLAKTDFIDVYRLNGDIEHPDEFEFHYTTAGEGAVFKSKPISPRSR